MRAVEVLISQLCSTICVLERKVPVVNSLQSQEPGILPTEVDIKNPNDFQRTLDCGLYLTNAA